MGSDQDSKDKRTEVHVDPFEAFWSFIEYVDETWQLVTLTTTALTNMTGMGRLAKVIGRAPEEVARKEELERLALDEVARGFPLLMAHTSVGLWSALEAALNSFAVDWLCFRPTLLQGDNLSKTKVPALLLSNGNFYEAAAFVIDEFTRQSGGSMKQGIGRFTIVLEALGISATVEDDVRKTLFELSKVRNVYAHRFGVVDEQFKKACPWIKIDVGQRLRTSPAEMERYARAAQGFVSKVADAASKTMSETEHEEVSAIQKSRVDEAKLKRAVKAD